MAQVSPTSSSSKPEKRVSNQANQQQQKRKWSDWSECNENCLKTRHRTNCDDLLVDQSSKSKQTTATATTSVQKQQQQGDKDKKREAIPEVDQVVEFPAAKLIGDQAPDDDGDYGDEGDDETEADSCANVDLSKTSEEIACIGGRCPILSKESNKLFAPVTRPQQHYRRPPLPQNRQHKAQQGNLDSQQMQNITVTSRPVITRPVDVQEANETRQQEPLPDGPANSFSTIWTKGMLSPRFVSMTGDSALTSGTNLIQWTILIGSLLAIILLIMLILRKLFVSTFPSYQWMLAKQTLKSSSKQIGAGMAECCQHHSSSSMGRGNLIPGSLEFDCPSDLHAATNLVAACHHPPPHQTNRYMCNWPHTNLPTKVSTQLEPDCEADKLPNGYHRFVVDANGRHLLAGSSLGRATHFNTDHQDYVAIEQATSSTSSNSYRQVRSLQQDASSNQYNYDTLNSSCYAPLAKEKAFISGTDFAQGPVDCERSDQEAPPNGQDDGQSVDGSPSSGSRVSLQSTTAQLLSHAASSSFEQPPEFGEFSTVASSSNRFLPNNDSINASPASLGGNKQHLNHKAKLAHLSMAQTAQSQPNSPMFANQFAGGKPKKQRRDKGLDRTSSQGETSSKEMDFSSRQNVGLGAGICSKPKGHRRTPSNTAVLRIVSDIEKSRKCDNDGDDETRHYYEEINHPKE